MSANTISEEHQEPALPAYKDPLSAKIVAGLAIFWLFIGILSFVFGIYGAINSNTHTTRFTNYQLNIILNRSYLVFFAVAAGCIITSALFFVIYNIACDIHRSEYNLRGLIINIQKDHIQTIKHLLYVDDSINRQSGVIIHQINNRSNSDKNRSQKETNAHDGAF